jgi:hypothetical protein
MTNQNNIAAAIMDDQSKLFEVFIICDQTVGTFKWVVMLAAIHLQRRLH